MGIAPSLGSPPSISRAGDGAWTTPCSQVRQAYFGRTVTIIPAIAGTGDDFHLAAVREEIRQPTPVAPVRLPRRPTASWAGCPGIDRISVNEHQNRNVCRQHFLA